MAGDCPFVNQHTTVNQQKTIILVFLNRLVNENFTSMTRWEIFMRQASQ